MVNAIVLLGPDDVQFVIRGNGDIGTEHELRGRGNRVGAVRPLVFARMPYSCLGAPDSLGAIVFVVVNFAFRGYWNALDMSRWHEVERQFSRLLDLESQNAAWWLGLPNRPTAV